MSQFGGKLNRGTLIYYSLLCQMSSNPDPAYSKDAIEALFANEDKNETNKQNYAAALRKLENTLFDIYRSYPNHHNREEMVKSVCINSFKEITISFFPDKDPSQIEEEAIKFFESTKTLIVHPDEKVRYNTSTNSSADIKAACLGLDSNNNFRERALVLYSPIDFRQRAVEYSSKPTVEDRTTLQQTSVQTVKPHL